MKKRTKIIIGLLLVLPLMAGVASVIANQRAISEARQERQKLVEAAVECERLQAENKQLSRVSVSVKGMTELKEENAELPKLRNEVRQLRRQAEELEKLREENKRLSAQQKSRADKPAMTALPAGFISRAAMADVGQATPEAAVQTMFWAMCNGDIKRMSQCALDATVDELEGKRAERAKQEIKREMESFPGFAISEKNVISEDVVRIGMQSSVNGAVMKFTVKRKDGVWKLDKAN